MNDQPGYIVAQFDLHTRLYNNVLEGVTDDLSLLTPGDTTNHIKWLAGHLVYTRLLMKDYGDLEDDPTFDLFRDEQDPEAGYPELSHIIKKWNVISDPLSEGLRALKEEELLEDGPLATPIDDRSLAGFLAFLMHHEAYHIGQLGLLRRYVGLDAMSYV